MVRRMFCGVLVLALAFACVSCALLEPNDYTSETSKSEASTEEISAISSDNSIWETIASSTTNATSTSMKATAVAPSFKQDFPYPDISIIKLEMDALPKTEYKVGEALEVTTKLTNTASWGYGLAWQRYLIKVWLERVGDDPLPMITPMGLFYLSANETMENHSINGLAGHSESYVFNKSGTYRLTVSAAFDVCDFRGTEKEWEKVKPSYLDASAGKKSYIHTLPPIIITVTD